MEATREGATTERLMGILGWNDPEPAAEEAKPEAVEEAKEEPVAATQEEAKEAEATEDQPEVEAQAETEEAVEQTEDAQEVTPPATLTELAERLGIDPDKLYEIRAKTKIDGQEGEATLAQLLKSYQLDGHLTRKSMELAERQKTFDQEAQKLTQEAQERVRYLDDALTIATNILNDRYKGVNWEELKAQDPTLFNTRYIEYQQHQQQLASAYQALQIERERAGLLEQQKFADYLKSEGEKLVNAVPEWADEKVAKKERGEIRDYLKSYGYQDEEIQQVYNHRWVLVLRDALRGRKAATAKPPVLKKVAQAPKLVKPGTKPSKTENQETRLRDLRKQHKAGNKQAGIQWLKDAGIV